MNLANLHHVILLATFYIIILQQPYLLRQVRCLFSQGSSKAILVSLQQSLSRALGIFYTNVE